MPDAVLQGADLAAHPDAKLVLRAPGMPELQASRLGRSSRCGSRGGCAAWRARGACWWLAHACNVIPEIYTLPPCNACVQVPLSVAPAVGKPSVPVTVWDWSGTAAGARGRADRARGRCCWRTDNGRGACCER